MKKVSSIILITIIITLAFFTANSADVEYIYNGYHYYYNSNEMAVICGWDGNSGEFVVPNKLSESFVEEIDSFAFKNNQTITSIDFSPATRLDTIGTYAFNGCTSLAGELEIPRKISFIGDSAFMECSSITSVVYSANTDTVPRQCFKGCTSLRNVTINPGAKEIEAFAFDNCASLENVFISKTVESINKTAFRNCSGYTIQCYRGSYAEQFAKDNSIEYEILDPVKGDTNGSDKIDINDATLIQKYKAGIITLSRTALRAADVNGDGQVTVRDATLIQMRIANIINEF